jgi:nucleoside-diphosphate-sugar epimerase
MRILVTGASGFIGNVLVRRAAQMGHSVVASVRVVQQKEQIDRRAVAVVVGDLGPDTDWSAAVAGVEVVIHLAGRAHVLRERAVSPEKEFERANIDGTMCLARQAHAAGVRRFVFVSSAGVGGAVSGAHALRETDTPRPVSLYARTKWAAEQALTAFAASSGLEYVVVRPTLVYGAGAPGNLQRLLAAIDHGIPLPLAGVRNQRSLVGVDNLCDLLLRCATHAEAAGRTFYAADGVVSTPELVRTFAEGMRRPARLIPVPVPAMRLLCTLVGKKSMFEQLYHSLVVDSTAAAQTVGWLPRKSIRSGLLEAAGAFAMRANSREQQR